MKAQPWLAALLAFSGSTLACEGLTAQAAWVRLPPPGMPMTAGYVRLGNVASRALTIDKVSSPDFGDVTLHQTVDEDGVSRMRPALPLLIKAGTTRALEPGGYHLMLMKPGHELRAGNNVEIRFQCDGQATEFPFTLRKDAP